MLLSYKKWQKLNENFGVSLGVKTPGKIGQLHSKWDEAGMSMPMMKKKSKKMFGGDDGPDMGSADLGGGDDAPMPMPKKKGKKPPFPPHGGDDDDTDLGGPDADMGGDDDHDDLDADIDGDDLDHDHDDDGGDGGDDDGGPDLGDDDGDEGPSDDDGGDLGGDLGGDEGPGPGVGGPDDDMPAPKKKGGSFIDKTKAVADGAKMMHKGANKMIKGMKEAQEAEFFRSLKSQTGGTKFAKDDCGSWSPVTEDSVIPPSDPNADITDDEPGPGEPGYAPHGRVGGFNEWVQKYQRKAKNIGKKRK